MAKKDASPNGHDRLEEAMALLIHNQAAFVGQLAEATRHNAENERRHLEFGREAAERFGHIEAQMRQVIEVLAEHGRKIDRLTDAVREKIGFKAE